MPNRPQYRIITSRALVPTIGWRDLEDAVRHAPHTDAALVELANYIVAQSLWDDAKVALRELIRRGYRLEDAYCNLGTVFMRQGQDQEAMESYRHALEINPDNQAVLENMQYLAGRQREARDLHE